MFTLTLTPQQMQVVLAALGKMPIEFALDTFSDIQRQLKAHTGTPAQPLRDAAE